LLTNIKKRRYLHVTTRSVNCVESHSYDKLQFCLNTAVDYPALSHVWECWWCGI